MSIKRIISGLKQNKIIIFSFQDWYMVQPIGPKARQKFPPIKKLRGREFAAYKKCDESLALIKEYAELNGIKFTEESLD